MPLDIVQRGGCDYKMFAQIKPNHCSFPLKKYEHFKMDFKILKTTCANDGKTNSIVKIC